MKARSLTTALAVLTITAGAAFAAPCNTGATKGKSPGQTAANDKSSDVDHSSKNTAGGQQPASPGTVGAMNNVGANQMVGTKPGASGGDSANLAGGKQPASPGTVGAMNNAGAEQGVGQKDDGC